MIYEINETHDPNLRSWVESANDPNTDFPIQNLPFCYFDRTSSDGNGRIGILIGNQVLDLVRCREDGLFEIKELSDIYWSLSVGMSVSNLFTKDRGEFSSFRRRLIEILHEKTDEKTRITVQKNLVEAGTVYFALPVYDVPNYTDFYCSIFHATNVGSMFRPDNPLLPNYKYVPIGYHGRASSIVVSGTPIRRPKGQNHSDADAPPVFMPCKNLDYEMEVGFFVGKSNDLGEPVPIKQAEDHIFGLCLVNDWSARDIQAWEYQPLGPFLAKSFATTVSPFVVTMEALAPFRTSAFERAADDPQPLPYLSSELNQKFGGLDVKLEVLIQTPKMKAENIEPFLLSRSNMRDLYWTIGQMLTHHASNGCNLQTGDLIATGTVSGQGKTERGSLLELTWRGTEPIELPSGEQRRFLEDGDEVIMRGYCEREGFRRIGFGECRGVIVPASE